MKRALILISFIAIAVRCLAPVTGKNFQPRVAFTNSLASDPTLILWLRASTVEGVGAGNPVPSWTDLTTYGNHATQLTTNIPSYSANVEGTLKRGIVYGGSQWHNLPNSSSLNLTSDFTCMAWVYTPLSTFMLFIGGYEPASPFAGYGFAVAGNFSRFPCVFVGADGIFHDADSQMAINEWEHIAVSVTGGVATFYLNGVADGTEPCSSPNPWSGFRAIGAAAGGALPLTGYMTDVRIYSRALGASEVASIFAANLD